MSLFNLEAKISLDAKDYERGIKEAKKSMADYKKDVMSLAQTYKKQGMDMSTAMRRAYAEIDKSQYESVGSAKKTSREVTKEWKTASKKIASNVSNAIKTIKKIGLAVGGAAATVTLALGKIGLDYNSQMESYTTNFKVMLGSTEAAIEKVEELKEMAAKTPFGMSDLADATQTLLSFQVPAERTNEVLKMLGDISLGNKEKMKGLALVFGQVSSAGKLQGQDLMQMINQGFNPLNYIAQRTGESMEELRDRMSKGAISAEEVEQAFRDATSEGGQFHNGMEEASKTMEGLKSTLTDVIHTKLGEFFQGVSNKIKEALPNVIEFVESINVEEVQAKLKKMLDVFVALIPVIVAVTAATYAYKAAVAIAGIIDLLRKATESQTIAQAALNAIMSANPFVLVATLIAAVAAALGALWVTNEGFRDAVAGIWEKIKAVFLSAWEQIKAIWDQVQPYFSAVWENIKQVFSVVVEVLGGFFSQAWDAIKTLWDTVSPYFQRIWESIKNTFSSVVSIFSTIFSAAWDAIKFIWDAVSPYFELVWIRIKTIFSVVADVLGGFFSLAWNNIVRVWDTVSSYFATIWDTISGIFSAVESVLSGDFSEAWESIKGVFSSWGDFFSGLWENVVDAFKDVGSFFVETGKKIVNSIKDGIAAAWDGIVSWFNNLWDSLFGDRTVSVNVQKTQSTTAGKGGGGISKSVDGSHADGLYSVPFDGYIAELHKGERVLTAKEADNYNKGKGGVTVVQNIYSEAKTAADLMRESLYQQEKAVLLGV